MNKLYALAYQSMWVFLLLVDPSVPPVLNVLQNWHVLIKNAKTLVQVSAVTWLSVRCATMYHCALVKSDTLVIRLLVVIQCHVSLKVTE